MFIMFADCFGVILNQSWHSGAASLTRSTAIAISLAFTLIDVDMDPFGLVFRLAVASHNGDREIT